MFGFCELFARSRRLFARRAGPGVYRINCLGTIPAIASEGTTSTPKAERKVALAMAVLISEEGPDRKLTLAGSGDAVAFADIYDVFAADIFRLIKTIVRDPAQSEEVTQEVFLDVWRTASAFDGSRGSSTAWIKTIARRRAIDRVRSEQRYRDRQSRVVDETPAFDPTHAAIDAHILAEAMCCLTASQREAIMLVYFGSLTHLQIADRLAVPLGTVKSRVRDGLLRLRASLQVSDPAEA